jgi:hypothetical protein
MQVNNTNFSFTVDFSDVELRKQRLDLVEGYYKVKITEAYINAERNANRVIFKLAFQGDYEGNTKLTGLNLPGTTQKDVRGLWMNLMLSAGYTLEQLKSGTIEITAANLVNRDACLYFRPKDEEATDGDMMYDKFNFLTPSNFESSKANFEARNQTAGKAASAPAAKPAAGFASPNVSSADLLNMVKG